MFWLVIVTLILIGLAFLLLEILVIPGTGIAGIIGFLLIGVGVWQAYEYYGSATGNWVLGGTLIVSIGILALALRSKTWRRIMLKSEINSRVNILDEERLRKGDIGKSVSRLAPTGKAMFNNEYVEVRTSGAFVDQGMEIEIVKVEDHKIYVKPKE